MQILLTTQTRDAHPCSWYIQSNDYQHSVMGLELTKARPYDNSYLASSAELVCVEYCIDTLARCNDLSMLSI